MTSGHQWSSYILCVNCFLFHYNILVVEILIIPSLEYCVLEIKNNAKRTNVEFMFFFLVAFRENHTFRYFSVYLKNPILGVLVNFVILLLIRSTKIGVLQETRPIQSFYTKFSDPKLFSDILSYFTIFIKKRDSFFQTHSGTII